MPRKSRKTMATMTEEQSAVFERNLPLAMWTAKRFGCYAVSSLDERCQRARIGLWKAVLSYRPERARPTERSKTYGISSHFAVQCMINEIYQTARDERRDEKHVCRTRRSDDDSTIGIGDRCSTDDLTPEKFLLIQESIDLDLRATRTSKHAIYRYIVERRTDGDTLAQIGQDTGLTRERIRQIVKQVRAEHAGEEGVA